MLKRELPSLQLPSLESFGDNDLINLAFASLVAGNLSSEISLILCSRLDKLKPFQLHYALRFFSFLKLASSDSCSDEVEESLKSSVRTSNLNAARRPQWKQAMQVSLATHGVFGSSVEVSPSLGGIFPVDAFSCLGGSSIVVEVDRPLNFIRDLNANIIRGDLYLELSRRLFSFIGVGDSGKMKVVNVRLKEWAAVPLGDIAAQIKFMKDLLRKYKRVA